MANQNNHLSTIVFDHQMISWKKWPIRKLRASFPLHSKDGSITTRGGASCDSCARERMKTSTTDGRVGRALFLKVIRASYSCPFKNGEKRFSELATILLALSVTLNDYRCSARGVSAPSWRNTAPPRFCLKKIDLAMDLDSFFDASLLLPRETVHRQER